MTTTYRYAWLAVLDGDGRRKMNEDLLAMDDVSPDLTRQNTPGAMWTIYWDSSPARLSTSALAENMGRDKDIEVLMVSVQGDERMLHEWIDTPQGQTLRAHALSVQPWVYSATTG